MTWDEQFRIGTGDITTEEAAPNIYRSYEDDCGIVMNQELFTQISRQFSIYAQRNALKSIQFTPRDVIRQGTSDYYFCHLQVKFPRNS